MTNLQQQLQQVANARRLEIIPYVYQVTQGKVQSGPFKGMAIVPKVSWGDGDYVAKLLGVYEDELHSFIAQAIQQAPDLVINIGCAEGYYAVGFAQQLPLSKVYAVDMNEHSVNICKENSLTNGVNNVEGVPHAVDCNWIQQTIENSTNPLLVVDCESAELELLDPSKVPALIKSSILVECHDCMIPGITSELTKRFETTHSIVSQDQTGKDPYKFEFLKSLSDCDKWALVHEGRPSTMTWLYMEPKQ